MEELLSVKNLSINFDTFKGQLQALRDVSFNLKKGEILAVAGESGCGKSVLLKSIMKLLPENARVNCGQIRLKGADITSYGEREMQKLRGRQLSIIFQEPATALNPTLSIGKQIEEAVRLHNPHMKKREAYQRVMELMALVEIDNPKQWYDLYPCHFSGGMLQRCVIAMALSCSPEILLADEPTTALDLTNQAQILTLLRSLQKKYGMAIIFVSHDLGAAAEIADRIAVMYAGKIIEIGTTKEIIQDPRHPYTWGLLRSLPSYAKPGEKLYTIPGMPPDQADLPKGDAFAGRNEYALRIDYEEMPPMFRITDTHYAATWLLDQRAPEVANPVAENREALQLEKNQTSGRKEKERFGEWGCKEKEEQKEEVPYKQEILLDVRHLTCRFHVGKKVVIPAVSDVSFQIGRGEIFGLVGESGSGKSTVARCIMNICQPQEGKILYQDVEIQNKHMLRGGFRKLASLRQMVFQDSTSSLNQRMKIADIITEPLVVSRKKIQPESLRAEAEFWIKHVGLEASYLDKYPFQLSGGQRQRVAIARALIMEPELLIADEPVSALDASVQAQILNLFKYLQKEHGFTFLFISHDLSVVRYLCDRVGVMHRGRLAETASCEEIFEAPQHPYTRKLLSAIPVLKHS